MVIWKRILFCSKLVDSCFFFSFGKEGKNAQLAFQPRLQVHLSCLQSCTELKIFTAAWTRTGHTGSSVLCDLAARVAKLYRSCIAAS